jgi:cytochrome c
MTRVLLAGLLAVALFAATVRPVSARSPEEVQALVERAAEHIREYGRQQAFADFNRPDGGFVDGELFIFCNDASGVQLANGGNPKMVGKNMSAVRDADGKLPARELYRIAQTKGQGWFEFLWPNPAKGLVEQKAAFVVRIDDQTICASGYYKPNPP